MYIIKSIYLAWFVFVMHFVLVRDCDHDHHDCDHGYLHVHDYVHGLYDYYLENLKYKIQRIYLHVIIGDLITSKSQFLLTSLIVSWLLLIGW